MEITHTQNRAVAVVLVTGRLDSGTAPQLTQYFDGVLRNEQTKLVVSLARLDYTGSAGLRVLLSAAKTTRARGGDLRVAAAQPNVKRVFEISGLTDVIQFYPDVATAVASF